MLPLRDITKRNMVVEETTLRATVAEWPEGGKRGPHIKRTGVLVGHCEKNLEVPRSWAWLKIFCTSKRYEFQTNTLSPVILFLDSIP